MVLAPTDHLSAAQQAQFNDLRQRFVAGLAARWAQITDAPDEVSLQSALHRLAGSAGAYGFERLGRFAREGEAQSRAGAASALPPLLGLLESEIASVMREFAADLACAAAPHLSQSGDNWRVDPSSNADMANGGHDAKGKNDGTARNN